MAIAPDPGGEAMAQIVSGPVISDAFVAIGYYFFTNIQKESMKRFVFYVKGYE
jgi:uncharacterized protein YbcC (UPF0753/DUF2309 family)